MNTVTTPTAEAVNREHRLARQCVESAVDHAIRCGQLLAEVKASLPHGQFGKWIETNCEFERSTATRYLKAAKQIATGVAISSLSHLFPSGKPDADSAPEPNANPWAHWYPRLTDPMARANAAFFAELWDLGCEITLNAEGRCIMKIPDERLPPEKWKAALELLMSRCPEMLP